MVGVYAHISARDVDQKDLLLHGCQVGRSVILPGRKFCMECGRNSFEP